MIHQNPLCDLIHPPYSSRTANSRIYSRITTITNASRTRNIRIQIFRSVHIRTSRTTHANSCVVCDKLVSDKSTTTRNIDIRILTTAQNLNSP